MTLKTFHLPDPGEGLTEAEIVSWKVAPGARVEVNDVVVEVETAKSLVELPIPWEGTIDELLVGEGETVDVGTPIITVVVQGTEAVQDADSAVSADETPDSGGAPAREPNLVGYGAITGSTKRRARTGGQAATSPGGRPLAAPPVRKYARDRGVDLARVRGSGEGGVVTRTDIDAFLAADGDDFDDSIAVAARLADGGGQGEVRVPVKGVRKVTAQAMSRSALTIPHVTEFVTLDMTASMALVERLRSDREFRDVTVTPLLLVAKALLLACRRNPGVNASWSQEESGEAVIVQKNYVNLGIATATPRGLVVPNIKDAHAMSVHELAEAMGRLVETARAGRTPAADMAGGSITVTNVGTFGIDTGTPLINPGEAAILCFGAVRRRPWVVERTRDEVGTRDDVGTRDEAGAVRRESIEARWVTQLALSFDHRLIDGDLGSRFLSDVAAVLSDPGKALLWA